MAKASNTGSLDTNVIVRLLLQDNPAQVAAAERIIETANRLHVADAAIIESVFVFEKVYRMPRPAIAHNIMTLIRHPRLICNRPLFGLALALYQANSKLSIVDCCLITYATLNAAEPLYTFDKEMCRVSTTAKEPKT